MRSVVIDGRSLHMLRRGLYDDEHTLQRDAISPIDAEKRSHRLSAFGREEPPDMGLAAILAVDHSQDRADGSSFVGCFFHVTIGDLSVLGSVDGRQRSLGSDGASAEKGQSKGQESYTERHRGIISVSASHG